MRNLLHVFLVLFIVPLFPSLLYSATITPKIVKSISQLCQDKPLILLGESHRQPDSQKLFLDLVRYYVQQGKRIFVGLEISADKQDKLDINLSASDGIDSDFSYLYPVIDYPAYREMIHSLGAMGENVIVKAIDAREDENDRDKVMSRNLKTVLSLGGYDKILVLVGNNHVIKDIKWHEDLGKKSEKYLAGYLIADTVCSIQQMFSRNDGTGDNSVLVKTDTERGSALAMEVLQYVNHSDSMSGNKVSDGVVVW